MKDYFRYCDDKSAARRYRGEASSTQATEPVVLGTSPNYCVDVDGEGDWALPNLNAVDEQFDRTVLMTKFAKQQGACRCEDVVVPLSMMYVVSSVLGRLPDSVAGNVFSNAAMWRNAEVSQLEMSYNRLVAHLRVATLECDTWRCARVG